MSSSGGTPAAGRPSGLQLAGVVLPSTPVPVGISQLISLAGAQLYLGQDWWGVAGSALPLNVQLDATGLHYPAGMDDQTFDIDFRANLACAAADDGKLVGLYINGNWGSIWQERVVKGGAWGHTVGFRGCGVDYLFKGDLNKQIQIYLDTSNLSQPSTLQGGGACQMQVTRRAAPVPS